jgi:hypothetical protein
MSKSKRPSEQPAPINLDGDEGAEVRQAFQPDGQAEKPDVPGSDAPAHPEFLDGPKEQPAAGVGVGGRPWVYSDGVIRRERQGDEARPRCPACTRDAVAVLCKATSSREVTHYRCECCRSFRAQVLRPAIAAQMKAGSYSPPNNKPFVERP